jgi:hypothetical protein
MTAEELRDFARRQPFEPFTIHMNDGSRLKVSAPDNFFMPRAWKFNAIVALERGRFSVIYLRNVAHVSTRSAWPKLRGGRKGKNGSSGEEE